jgi:hypothetical protein
MTETTIVLLAAGGGTLALEAAAATVGALVDHRHEIAATTAEAYEQARDALIVLLAQVGPALVVVVLWLLEHLLRAHGRHRAVDA